MPFAIVVPRYIINDSWAFTKSVRMGHRKDGSDGTAEQQLVGVIGQNMINIALGKPLMREDLGFDDGVDFEIYGLRIDVKTVGRTSDPKPHYVNNLLGSQIKFECDAYLFLSFNKTSAAMTFCGWSTKEMFLDCATLYAKDSIRYRADGSSFRLKADNFEIENSKLRQDFKDWTELTWSWYKETLR